MSFTVERWIQKVLVAKFILRQLTFDFISQKICLIFSTGFFFFFLGFWPFFLGLSANTTLKCLSFHLSLSLCQSMQVWILLKALESVSHLLLLVYLTVSRPSLSVCLSRDPTCRSAYLSKMLSDGDLGVEDFTLRDRSQEQITGFTRSL